MGSKKKKKKKKKLQKWTIKYHLLVVAPPNKAEIVWFVFRILYFSHSSSFCFLFKDGILKRNTLFNNRNQDQEWNLQY